jgi:ABC-2 type transport system permease protein
MATRTTCDAIGSISQGYREPRRSPGSLELLMSDDPALLEVVPRRRVGEHFRDIWRYRELQIGLVRRELKVRYKGSVLGFVWSLLNPLLYLVVFYFVFQVFLGSGIPSFPIFLLSGLLVWNLFVGSLPPATGSIIDNGSLVKKVWFPREILPIASVGAALVHFCLQSLVLFAAIAIVRYPLPWGYVWLVLPALVTLLVLTAALGVLLSAVSVYARDIRHLLDLVLLAWFWMTPIVYPYELVAGKLGANSWVALLNPMTPIVLCFQRGIYGKVYGDVQSDGTRQAILPDESQWWYLRNVLIVLVAASVLVVVAIKVFDRLEGSFAEEI